MPDFLKENSPALYNWLVSRANAKNTIAALRSGSDAEKYAWDSIRIKALEQDCSLLELDISQYPYNTFNYYFWRTPSWEDKLHQMLTTHTTSATHSRLIILLKNDSKLMGCLCIYKNKANWRARYLCSESSRQETPVPVQAAVKAALPQYKAKNDLGVKLMFVANHALQKIFPDTLFMQVIIQFAGKKTFKNVVQNISRANLLDCKHQEMKQLQSKVKPVWEYKAFKTHYDPIQASLAFRFHQKYNLFVLFAGAAIPAFGGSALAFIVEKLLVTGSLFMPHPDKKTLIATTTFYVLTGLFFAGPVVKNVRDFYRDDTLVSADALLKNAQYKEALRVYNQLSYSNPNDSAAIKGQIVCLSKLGYIAKANIVFASLIDSNANNYYEPIGDYFMQYDCAEFARRAFVLARINDPLKIELREKIIQLLLDSQQVEEAREEYWLANSQLSDADWQTLKAKFQVSGVEKSGMTLN